MARTTRSKAAATAPDPITAEPVTAEVTTSAASTNGAATKPENEEPKDDSRPKGQQRRGLRRKAYKKARMQRGLEELQKTLESAAGKPLSKRERSALRAQVHQPHRVRTKAANRNTKVSELEKVVKKQQEDIRELRKLAVGSVPKLQPPASPPAQPEAEAEPDSSPAKIRDQLFADAARSGGGEDGTTVLEVEEVVVERPAGDSSAGEPMEGVQETTVVTSVEQDVEYSALPSVEEITQVAEKNGGNKQEDRPEVVEEETAGATAPDPAPKLAADTPIKSKEEVRDSSAEDSNAGTPRNVRRSPRKKAPKRRSFAGHSYVG